MKTLTIIAREVPVESQVMLAGDVRQFRWKAAPWKCDFYRVYVNGRLAAVTNQTWHNFPDAAGLEWEIAARVEVFAEERQTCEW